MGGTNDRIQHDLGATLAGITLATVPAELWPKAEATNYLATEGDKQKKIGVRVPFIFVDLVKFLPIWIMDTTELSEFNEGEMEEEQSYLAKELSRAIGNNNGPKKTRGTSHTKSTQQGFERG